MSRLMTTIGAAVLSAVAALAIWGGSPSVAQEKGKFAAPPRPVTRWEYKIVFRGDEVEFNKLGDDGWELVTSYMNPAGLPTHTFKRPK